MMSISAIILGKQGRAVLEQIAKGPVASITLNPSGAAQLVQLGYAEKCSLPHPFPRKRVNKSLEHLKITPEGAARLDSLKEIAK